MISLDNEIRLANLLIAVADGEMAVEELRQKLAKHHDFDPFSLFRMFDRTNRGFVFAEEVQAVLGWGFFDAATSTRSSASKTSAPY